MLLLCIIISDTFLILPPHDLIWKWNFFSNIIKYWSIKFPEQQWYSPWLVFQRIWPECRRLRLRILQQHWSWRTCYHGEAQWYLLCQESRTHQSWPATTLTPQLETCLVWCLKSSSSWGRLPPWQCPPSSAVREELPPDHREPQHFHTCQCTCHPGDLMEAIKISNAFSWNFVLEKEHFCPWKILFILLASLTNRIVDWSTCLHHTWTWVERRDWSCWRILKHSHQILGIISMEHWNSDVIRK